MALNVSNHNGTLSADHFLDLKSIYSKSFVLNKSVLIEILHLFTCFNSLLVLGVWMFTRISAAKRNRCIGLTCSNLVNT